MNLLFNELVAKWDLYTDSQTLYQRIWVHQPSYKSANKWIRSILGLANYFINPSSTHQQRIGVHQPSYEPFNQRIRSCWGSINRIMNLLFNELAADWNSSTKSWIFLSMHKWWRRIYQRDHDPFTERINSRMEAINWFMNPLINALAAEWNPSTKLSILQTTNHRQIEAPDACVLNKFLKSEFITSNVHRSRFTRP